MARNNQLILISGSPGIGKSSILYFTALFLEKNDDYRVIPLSNPSQLETISKVGGKLLFLFDDVVGSYNVDEYAAHTWSFHMAFIFNSMLTNHDMKLIMTCRNHIMDTNAFKDFLKGWKIFTAPLCHYELYSGELILTLGERKHIFKSHNKANISSSVSDDLIMACNDFPLICSVYSWISDDISEHMNNPFDLMQHHFEKLKAEKVSSYIGLALLVIFNNTLQKEMFAYQYDALKKVITDVSVESETCIPEVMDVFRELQLMTYIYDCFDIMFCLPRIFDFVTKWISRHIPKNIIKYCSSNIIKERVQLETFGDNLDEFSFTVSNNIEKMYFERIVKDIKSCLYWSVFGSVQAKVKEFREYLIQYFEKHDLIESNIWQPDKSGVIPLHVCAFIGYADLCTFFVTQNVGIICCKTCDGLTALHIACAKGHSPIVSLLLQNKANIDDTFICGYTSLHLACLNGNTEIVEMLLNYNGAVDKAGNNGKTPLILACGFKYFKIVKLLLHFNASVNQSDNLGRTPLLHSCIAGDFNTVCLLLKHNALVDRRDKNELTPILQACVNGNVDVIIELLKYNASPNECDKYGCSCLYVASQNGMLQIMALLLEKKAKVNVPNTNGLTPLFTACDFGREKAVELLFRYNANVNYATKNGTSPLKMACIKEHEHIVKLLLENGASVTQIDNDGFTPLHFSCQKKNLYIVNQLLKHHAEINAVSKNGMSPLYVACMNNREDIIIDLLHNKADANLSTYHCPPHYMQYLFQIILFWLISFFVMEQISMLAT